MSTHPYLPLYVDDYDAATAHLTLEEDGVYSRLLRLCWRTPGCSLPDEPAWIARKIRMSLADFERVARPVLDEFFTRQRGRLVQRRLKAEYDDISRKKTARKNAGKLGGVAKARKSKEKTPDNANDLPPDTCAFPEPYPEPEPEDGGGGACADAQDDWPEGDHCRMLVAAAASPWLDPDKTLGLVTTAGRLTAWRRRGASWKLHVLPVVTGLASLHGEPISSWQFFEKAIGRAVSASRAELEVPDAQVAPLRPGGGASLTDRLAAEHAEARRLAFAMLDQKNGRSS